MLDMLQTKAGMMLGALLMLAACGEPVIDGPACTGLVRPYSPAPDFRGADSTTDPFVRVLEAQAAQVAGFAVPKTGIPIDVLAMTTGGQYGAFSSGVLTGWPEGERPKFNIVTGASAGAVIAPPAFAGKDFDDRLKGNVGISTKDVLTQRPFWTLPGSSSLYSTAKLRRRVSDRIDKPLLDAIKGRADTSTKGQIVNTVVLGAVNLDNGKFEVLDIGQYLTVTQDDLAQRKECLTEAVLASSAIPVLFPPRRIGGSLYADAGVRQHVFLERLARAQKFATQSTGRKFDVRVTMLVNGDLVVNQTEQSAQLIKLAQRNFQLVNDQGFRDSIGRVIRVVEKNKWGFRALMAPRIPPDTCTSPDPLFDACITNFLFEAGKSMTETGPIKWLNKDQLKNKINEF
ncbi:MAG: patatin-like phospholipase family protein [Ruegeria sp.]|uniref:patatin-like phospholipase family protein n=1 Tax=Ruegeria sp. TaxID=1879320 RepID=UPI00349EBDC0